MTGKADAVNRRVAGKRVAGLHGQSGGLQRCEGETPAGLITHGLCGGDCPRLCIRLFIPLGLGVPPLCE